MTTASSISTQFAKTKIKVNNRIAALVPASFWERKDTLAIDVDFQSTKRNFSPFERAQLHAINIDEGFTSVVATFLVDGRQIRVSLDRRSHDDLTLSIDSEEPNLMVEYI